MLVEAENSEIELRYVEELKEGKNVIELRYAREEVKQENNVIKPQYAGVEVNKLLQKGVDENQLSIATMLSIGKMRDYNKALHEYIRGKKGLVDTDKATEKINKLLRKDKRRDTKGFE